MSEPKLSGGFPPNPIHKPGYTLERHDEFDAPVLDETLWLPYYLPHWSSRAATAPRYAIEDGALMLQIERDQPPWCPEFDGQVRASSIQTGHFSGPLGGSAGQLRFSDQLVVREVQRNVRLYTPQYGYFEMRAKGPSASATHAALWMIGYEDTPERSGEICVCELLGAYAGETASRVKLGVHPWRDPALTDEFFTHDVDFDIRQFHLYAVEWTPERVDFYLDNIKVRTVNQSPRYPMQFMLSMYELPFEGAWNGAYDPSEPYPRRFTVDYFRAYQPVGGYR